MKSKLTPATDNATRETFTLPAARAKEILWEDDPDYKVVADDECGTNRWSNTHELIVQRISDGLFFRTMYRIGTGDEGERPWEYEETADFEQVFAKQVVTTTYE